MTRAHSVKVRTPFCQRSRHRQRDAWIQLRGHIRRSGQPHLPYLSRHAFEPDRPPMWNQWEDIFLLGLDGCMVWNVTITTVRRACWEEVDTAASESVENRLTSLEKEAERRRLEMSFSNDSFVLIPGRARWREWHPPAPVAHASLGGLTCRAALEQEVSRLVREDRPPIHEGWTLHRDYAYGIGVNAIVEEDHLDPAALMRFVDRFRAGGELAYRSPEPATRFLPDASEKDTYGADWLEATSRSVRSGPAIP